MNIFNRNNQNNNNPNVKSEQEMRAVLGNFSTRIDSIELRCLLYLLDIFHDSTSLAIKKIDITIPQKDHNITTAIFEKCLAIKKKNN